MVLTIVLVAGTVAYRMLGLTWVDALYQTLITITTVGYGEIPPESGPITPTYRACLLYTSPSPRDRTRSRMPSSA